VTTQPFYKIRDTRGFVRALMHLSMEY